MADTSIGQVQAFFALMSKYYEDTGNYYQDPTSAAPLFMELLPNINYNQVVTEATQTRTANPSMVNGALIESSNSMFAILREASLRSKTRYDFWAEVGNDNSLDSEFYSNQGYQMAAFIRGKHPQQN